MTLSCTLEDISSNRNKILLPNFRSGLRAMISLWILGRVTHLSCSKNLKHKQSPDLVYRIRYALDIEVLVRLVWTGVRAEYIEYSGSYEGANEQKILIYEQNPRSLDHQSSLKFQLLSINAIATIKMHLALSGYIYGSSKRFERYIWSGVELRANISASQVNIHDTLLCIVDLAESDLPYTRGLMNAEVENFTDKEVLILGGGDGALLWELLKEKPKFVTMIDIDDAVMRGCRKFMRSACGDCMDNYDGQNYKIIVGDAIAYMRDYHKEGLQFDYVFGDLTDVPISKTDRGEIWDFMRTIMNLGTSLLKPGTGKYMTHAIGVGCESALKMFEQNLSSLETPVTFTQTSAYVPSFMEKWCFYQTSKQAG
ncbi:unnamed protein product, partial [Meganyctiphanes norvegica]